MIFSRQTPCLLVLTLLLASCRSPKDLVDHQVSFIDATQAEYEVVTEDTLTLYYQKEPRELKKVEGVSYEFYYEKEELIFMKIEEDVFYFDDGEMSLWIKSGDVWVHSRDEGFKEMEEAVMEKYTPTAY
jgi:hypothetical protein